MKLDEYQELAKKTDIVEADEKKRFLVPLIGLIGETGSLIAEYKKYLRDGMAYENFSEHLKEELGDVLWYVATLARRQNLDLSKIADHVLMLRSPMPLPISVSGGENSLNTFQKNAAKIQRFDIPEETNLFAALIETSNKSGELIELIEQRSHMHNPDELRTVLMIGLGSILWQLAYIASIKNIKFEDVAKDNLNKIISRWPGDGAEHTPLFDMDYPEHEQFHRHMEIIFKGYQKEDGTDFTIISCNGIQIGDRLTDNTYEDTGYRFHDSIHYAFLAILGWSPIMRRLFKVKRKSNAQKDEVDDGARAGIIEEAIVGLTYDYARDQEMLKNQNEIDYSRIKIIQKLCRGLEVEQCKPWEWKIAILKGYEMFRNLRKNKGGTLILDLTKRDIAYKKP